jgi:hypothetical protein
VAAYRFLLEFGLILVSRDCKWARTKFLFRGVLDGLRTAVDGLSETEHKEPQGVRSSPQSAEP